MYDYSTMSRSDDRTDISSVAMNFDGRYIEDEIQGYQTLTVSGREALSYDIETVSGSGQDGVRTANKKLPARYIEIKYKLEAKDSAELQFKFRQLNQLLHSHKEVPIKFLDDLDFIYYGEVIEFGDIPPDRINIVSTFRIQCGNPYKFGQIKTFEGNPLVVQLDSPYEVKPLYVEIQVEQSTTKIRLRNTHTGRNIILNGNYVQGDVIRINIADNKVTKNWKDIKKELDYAESDFHGFKLFQHDEVDVIPRSSQLKIEVRGQWK